MTHDIVKNIAEVEIRKSHARDFFQLGIGATILLPVAAIFGGFSVPVAATLFAAAAVAGGISIVARNRYEQLVQEHVGLLSQLDNLRDDAGAVGTTDVGPDYDGVRVGNTLPNMQKSGRQR